MERSNNPTSQYKVYCDTFDMILTADIHENKGERKLLMEIASESGDSKESLSLYREDVEVLSKFLDSVKEYLDKR